MIDWDVAISTGTKWARPGPQVSLAEARRTVSELRDLAGAVQQPVHEVTGMSAASDGSIGRIAVVDRPGWIRANVDGFRVVLEPLVEQLRERAPGKSGSRSANGVMTAVGSRVTGIQTGLILAYLSSRVLGQYELFLPPETSPSSSGQSGRLTLVAPNIVMVERELEVDSHDFRRWVCLHEETHRLQFTAVSWLRDYVQSQMTEFLLASELDPAAILQRLRSAADAAVGAVRGGDGGNLIDAVATPLQREIMSRLTSVMTLVEGHGDYVMDAVGPRVVPSVEQIRERFNSRRGSQGRVEQAIRRVLGIDLKMKQYAEGSRFVKAVVDEVGMQDFNKVWTSPETLPTRDEFTDPHKWVERVVSPAKASSSPVSLGPASNAPASNTPASTTPASSAPPSATPPSSTPDGPASTPPGSGPTGPDPTIPGSVSSGPATTGPADPGPVQPGPAYPGSQAPGAANPGPATPGPAAPESGTPGPDGSGANGTGPADPESASS